MKRLNMRFEAYEASFNAPPILTTKGFGPNVSGKMVPLPLTMSELLIAQVRAPPLVIHRERVVKPIVPMDTIVESSARLASTKPAILVSGDDPTRSFTLKNSETLREFSGEGTLVLATWLIEISQYIGL